MAHPFEDVFKGASIAAKLADASRAMSGVVNHKPPEIVVGPSPLVESVQQNYASEFYARLRKWIEAFDSRLDESSEVGVRLVTFGQSVVFHLESLGYSDPSHMVFAGTTEGGDPVELIQHVSQISVLLMKLPRKNPGEPKRPIGFHATPLDEDKQ